ncbi:MAG: hypothetical protein ACE5I1_21605 [bacterium]
MHRSKKAHFIQAFAAFTAACNTCHSLEKVEYFNIVVPKEVDSLIKLKKEADSPTSNSP